MKFKPVTNVTIMVCLSVLCAFLFYIKREVEAATVMGAVLMFIKSD